MPKGCLAKQSVSQSNICNTCVQFSAGQIWIGALDCFPFSPSHPSFILIHSVPFTTLPTHTRSLLLLLLPHSIHLQSQEGHQAMAIHDLCSHETCRCVCERVCILKHVCFYNPYEPKCAHSLVCLFMYVCEFVRRVYLCQLPCLYSSLL